MIYEVEDIDVFHDFVMIERVNSSKTPGGLELPEMQDNESNLAKIVKVGPGYSELPRSVPQCKPGEYWIMARFIGTKFPMNGKEFTLVKWADCQAKVKFSDRAENLLND